MAQRTTRFLGIALGATVSITALQAGQTVSAGPIQWGVDPGGGEANPNFSISFTAVTPTTSVWPETRWVKATVSGPGVPAPGTFNDQQTHTWAFYWSQLEAGTTFRHFIGPMSALADPRVMPGRWCAHSPSTPGAKSWRCVAVNMADWSQWTFADYDFSVPEPTSVFTQSQRLVVATDSDWSVFPPHDVVNRYTTVQAALATLAGRSGRAAVYLKRGQTFTITTGHGLGSLTGFWLGAAGAGARPVITVTPTDTIFFLNQIEHWLSDVVIEGTSNLSSSPWTARGQWALGFNATNVRMYARNVVFRNMGLPVQMNSPAAMQLSFVDCEFAGHAQSATLTSGPGTGDENVEGVPGQGAVLCYRGVRTAHNQDQLWTPSQADANGFNGGFGHRDGGYDVAVYDACHMFTRSGWFENAAPSSRRSLQSPMRCGAIQGSYVGISRVVSEVGLSIGKTNAPVMIGDVVIDSCHIICHNSNSGVGSGLTGVSVRNTTSVIPPQPAWLPGSSSAIELPGDSDPQGFFPNQAATRAVPNYSLNNTLVWLQDDTSRSNVVSPAFMGPVGGNTITEVNLARFQPHMPTPTNDGPFDRVRQALPLMNGHFDGLLANRGSMLVTNLVGQWTSGTAVGDVQVEGRIDRFLMLTGIPTTPIRRGAFTNGAGGTATVTIGSHSHRAITAAPHWVLEFDGLLTDFAIGATLTNGTATAEIRYVRYSGTTGTLWLGPVTGGSFSDNDAITDNRGGSATANGPQSSATGYYASWRPLAGSPVIGAGSGALVPPRDQTGAVRATSYARGALEPA